MHSIQILYRYIYTSTIQEECAIQCSLCSVSLRSVKTWMEGTYDMPHTNSPVFGTSVLRLDMLKNSYRSITQLGEIEVDEGGVL